MKSLAFKKSRKKEEVRVVEKTYVTMSIGGNLFGIDVGLVNTVYGMTEIREVPGLMDYMKGIITIRERVIPVIDLRIKFNIPDISDTKDTVIVIADIKGETAGMIVDSVYDVVSVTEDSIQELPSLGESVDARYVDGIIKTGDDTIVIIDPGSILTDDELAGLEKVHSAIA